MELKNKDMKILVELRKNARAPLTDISKETKIPISTIYERLKAMTNNAIGKFASLINYEKLGFNTRANICIKCHKNSKKEALELLTKNINVNSIYKINNGFDYMAEVIFKNLKELEDFLEHLEDKNIIKESEVYHIVEEIKREKFLSDKLDLEMLIQT